jgi:hypothetical protein
VHSEHPVLPESAAAIGTLHLTTAAIHGYNCDHRPLIQSVQNLIMIIPLSDNSEIDTERDLSSA